MRMFWTNLANTTLCPHGEANVATFGSTFFRAGKPLQADVDLLEAHQPTQYQARRQNRTNFQPEPACLDESFRETSSKSACRHSRGLGLLAPVGESSTRVGRDEHLSGTSTCPSPLHAWS